METKRPQQIGPVESRRQHAGEAETAPAAAPERAPATMPATRSAPKRRVSHVRQKTRRGMARTIRAMTPEEMRRKGSWAVRFYGRSGPLPRLIDEKGRPTRFALTAAEWGEPVPKTVAAARRIAAKGHKLLTAYKRAMARRKR